MSPFLACAGALPSFLAALQGPEKPSSALASIINQAGCCLLPVLFHSWGQRFSFLTSGVSGVWLLECKLSFSNQDNKNLPKFRCVCTALFWEGLLEASQVITEFGFGLGSTLKHVCHGHTFHYPRVIQALSCLDLDPSRSGAAIISLGTVGLSWPLVAPCTPHHQLLPSPCPQHLPREAEGSRLPPSTALLVAVVFQELLMNMQVWD